MNVLDILSVHLLVAVWVILIFEHYLHTNVCVNISALLYLRDTIYSPLFCPFCSTPTPRTLCSSDRAVKGMAGPTEQRYVLFLFWDLQGMVWNPGDVWEAQLFSFWLSAAFIHLPWPWMGLCLPHASTLNPEDQLLTMNVTLISSEGSSWKPLQN